MDIHLLDAAPTAAERAAVDARARPAGRRLGRRRARLRARGPLARAAATTPARARHLLLPALHAVQARVGWISPGALNYVCRAADHPARRGLRRRDLLRAARVEPRPPRVVHVCDDIACRCRGARGADRAARGAPRRRGRAHRRRIGARWLASPCLGLCDRAPAALLTIAGEDPERARARRPSTAQQVLAAARRPRRRGRGPGDRPCRRRGDPSLRLLRARRPSSTRRASTTTAPHGGYEALRRALELGPRGRDPRGQRLEAAGPRRRRLPDRRASGRPSPASRRARTTWSATPTSPSRARSRTGS